MAVYWTLTQRAATGTPQGVPVVFSCSWLRMVVLNASPHPYPRYFSRDTPRTLLRMTVARVLTMDPYLAHSLRSQKSAHIRPLFRLPHRSTTADLRRRLLAGLPRKQAACFHNHGVRSLTWASVKKVPPQHIIVLNDAVVNDSKLPCAV